MPYEPYMPYRALCLKPYMYLSDINWTLVRNAGCRTHRSPAESEALGVQFRSVAQSCPILCDPRDRSTPGLVSAASPQRPARLTSVGSVPPSVAAPAGDCGHAEGAQARPPPASGLRPQPRLPSPRACCCPPTAPAAPLPITLPAFVNPAVQRIFLKGIESKLCASLLP